MDAEEGESMRLLFAPAAIAALASAQIDAQSPAPAAPQVWQLNWQENQCTIATGDATSAGLAVWVTPGDPKPDLYFVGSPKVLPKLGGLAKATVTLLPSGERFSAPVMDVSEGTRVLRLIRLGEEFPAKFAQSTSIRLDGSKETIAVKGADEAMSALSQCATAKLPEWGVDAKAYSALRKAPTDIGDHLWFTNGDYPSRALENREVGDTIARMDVDKTGKVTSCAVVVSSGSSALDYVTCSTSLKKGKFLPAIGPDGQAVAAQRIVRVVFRIAN